MDQNSNVLFISIFLSCSLTHSHVSSRCKILELCTAQRLHNNAIKCEVCVLICAEYILTQTHTTHLICLENTCAHTTHNLIILKLFLPIHWSCFKRFWHLNNSISITIKAKNALSEWACSALFTHSRYGHTDTYSLTYSVYSSHTFSWTRFDLSGRFRQLIYMVIFINVCALGWLSCIEWLCSITRARNAHKTQ